MENFRKVKDYEGFYEVSDLGNVKSVERTFIGGFGAVCHTGGKLLVPHINKNRQNRVQVCLCKDGKPKLHFVSILVAKSFPEICGEWFEGCQVDHIDGNPSNNVATNLRCVTRSQNMQNPVTKERAKARWSDEMRQKYSERLKANNPVSACTAESRAKVAEAQRGKPNFKCWRKVACYDIEGNFIKEYESVTGASIETGIKCSAISNTANGRQRTGGGYEWKFC